LNVGKVLLLEKQTQVHAEKTRGAGIEVTQKLHEETWNAASRAATRNGQTGQLLPPRHFCKHDAIHILHMKSSFLRLRYLYVNFSRQLCRMRAASYWIKVLTNQCTMFPETTNTEQKTSC